MDKEQEKKVKEFFYPFENLRCKMSLMEGPGIFCYSLPTLARFSKNNLCPLAEKVVDEHLSHCQWCRYVVLSLLAIDKAFFNAKRSGLEKAVTNFYNLKILTELVDAQSELAQKLLRAWNII